MKSVKGLFFFIAAGVLAASCNKVSHKKTPGGMPYRVYSGKGSTPIRPGYVVKLNFSQIIKDSVYYDSHDKMPIYWPVSQQTTPYDISELWTSLRKGDSVIATQMIDTFIKRNPASVPPDLKNGDRIVTTIKILEVFTSDSLARADEEKTKKAWLDNEIVHVQKYLADKKINAQKTPSGAFVEITNPGEGNLIDSGKYVSVMYTGTTFEGKMFDSNIDTSFHHTEPMTFAVSTGQMIKGFDESMRLLRPGSEANLYIPSMLAYGPMARPPHIKAFENLKFYLKVVDVKDAPAPPPPPPGAPGKVDKPQPK